MRRGIILIEDENFCNQPKHYTSPKSLLEVWITRKILQKMQNFLRKIKKRIKRFKMSVGALGLEPRTTEV